MKRLIMLFTILLTAGTLFAQNLPQPVPPHANSGKSGLAIKGYDPVSYHHKQALKGSAQITAMHKGLRYRFTSEENKKAFQADPSKFEPAYGGWCAWAMLVGDKVDINPKRFKVIDGRTYLYYDGFFGNTLKKWNQKADKIPEPQLVKTADEHWEKLTQK